MVHDYASDGTLAQNEGVLREQLAALEAQVVADAADEADSEPTSSQLLSSEPESLPIDTLSLSRVPSPSTRSSRSTIPSHPSRTSSAFPSLPSRPSSASASRSAAITDYDDLESEKDFLTALFPHLCAALGIR